MFYQQSGELKLILSGFQLVSLDIREAANVK
jgi:hypothetical protein